MNHLNDDFYYSFLRKEVEKKSGMREKTSHNFEILSEKIQSSGAGYLSSSTLKRFWNYVKDTGRKNMSTLDVLARYAGYEEGYWQFRKTVDETVAVESDYDSKRVLDVLKLAPGAEVEVSWQPARKVLMRYIGEALFEVERSVNSKLSEGMRVRCARIVEGEPLILDLEEKKNDRTLVYEAGKINGVTWHIK